MTPDANRPAMDVVRLPQRALIDTGVLIRALGQRPNEPISQDCRDFVDAMVKAQRELLFAAPSLAEYLRGPGVQAPPATVGLQVVSFDSRAAVKLANLFPASMLKEVRTSTGLPMPYIKYDAMIAACAIRHDAEVIVVADLKFAKQVPKSIPVVLPGEYRQKQMSLIAVDGGMAATSKRGKKK